MTTWLCPIKLKSWEIAKKKHVYGLPCNRKEELEKLRIGDLLAIYLFPPIRGIVGICKVTSHPFVGYELLWGDSRMGKVKYPCRINVEPIPELSVGKKKAIRLYKIIGYVDHNKGIEIEPYLRNVLFVELTESQSRILVKELLSPAP